MLTNNSSQNIFRFMQLRSPESLRESHILFLSQKTPLARLLIDSADQKRTKMAKSFLGDRTNYKFLDKANELLSIYEQVIKANGNVKDLRTKAANNMNIDMIREQASDVLLAAKFVDHKITQLDKIEKSFIASYLILDSSVNFLTKLRKFSSIPISLPRSFDPQLTSQLKQTDQTKSQNFDLDDIFEGTSVNELHRTLLELISLIKPSLLKLPTSEGIQTREQIFILNEIGINTLSNNSKITLGKIGLEPELYPLDWIIRQLELKISRALLRKEKNKKHIVINNQSSISRPVIRNVGVADLLVVKQHLKGYKRLDIAHIENILIGEKKSRKHRDLERTEELTTTEEEVISEKQSELQSSERFEMNRETSDTMQRDQQLGMGLTLSGKYGPTEEFSSNLQTSSSSSTENSITSASRFAKDIMERSLENIIERVRTERIRRLVKEQEEINLHSLNNLTKKHIIGIYQFVEKIYETQIFNYGIRQMFDFVIPEPASYIWYIEQEEAILKLPSPPINLNTLVPNASALDRSNYIMYAGIFGVTDVEPPPPTFISVTGSIINGQESLGNESEAGRPRSLVEKQIAIPEGYEPYRAKVNVMALTDAEITITMTLGHARYNWTPPLGDPFFYKPVGGADDYHKIGIDEIHMPLMVDAFQYDPRSTIPFAAIGYETNSYTLSLEVICKLLHTTYEEWQLMTYAKLLTAYLNNVQKYDAKVAELKTEAKNMAEESRTKYGAPPSQNLRMIKNELKKHCISILTRQRYEDAGSMQNGDPPFFDFDEAIRKGNFIKFFEQAFEWDQLQYVFYPYFWAREDTHKSRFIRGEIDFQYLEFLQAGSARVVVPVRPGFELAITYYLENKVIWNGDEDGQITIEDPLYVPIINEIKERNGADQGEIAIGDPWETQVPTPLVILRTEEDLPKWRRTGQSKWDWMEDEN